MNIDGLRNFITEFNVNEGEISVKLVEKINNKYVVYQPTLAVKFKEDLIKLYSEVLQARLFELTQEAYNPNVGQDGYLQTATLDIANVDSTIEELEDECNIQGDLQEIELEKINFYVIKIECLGKAVYIFRRFAKMKKIRRGILGFIEDNELKKIINKFYMGIDRDIDIIVYEEEMLIINRFALQTIFNQHDYFIDRANIALSKIEENHVVENFSQFKEDCLNDRQAIKRITKIVNTPDRLSDFLNSFGMLVNVIEEAKLSIELNSEGQIMYDRSREMRSEILFCIADAYYESLLLNRIGEDISQ